MDDNAGERLVWLRLVNGVVIAVNSGYSLSLVREHDRNCERSKYLMREVSFAVGTFAQVVAISSTGTTPRG